MHKNIHVHLYRITIEYTRTLLYNTVRNKENKDVKERLEGRIEYDKPEERFRHDYKKD